jgi:putative hydrolase of the HAD superfamily
MALCVTQNNPVDCEAPGRYYPAMPEALLFDLDDTIVAYDAVAEECWRNVCALYTTRCHQSSEKLYLAIKEARDWYLNDEERHRWHRLNLRLYRRNAVSRALATLGLDVPDLADEIADSYGAQRDAATYVQPGAKELLLSLKEQGKGLALVTNGASEGQRDKIRRHGLGDIFDVVVIEGELGVGKPDERVFFSALKRLGKTAEQVWMVGDDLARDIAGAQRIGILSIWVDWRNAGLPPFSPVKPDRIVRSISELSSDF